MKNSVTIDDSSLMVNFSFPIEVGQVKMIAIGQVFISKSAEGKLTGDFDFIDHNQITFMGMPVSGYKGWKKLCAQHEEWGVDLRKLTNEEFNKVVDADFKQHFLNKFSPSMFDVQ